MWFFVLMFFPLFLWQLPDFFNLFQDYSLPIFSYEQGIHFKQHSPHWTFPKSDVPYIYNTVFSSFLSTSCTTRTLWRSRPLFAGMNSCCAKCVSQLHCFCVSISCTCCDNVLEPSHMASHVCQDDFHMSSCALSLRFSKHKSWPEPSSHARQPQTAQRKIWLPCQKIAIANWPSAAQGGHLQWTSNRCLHHKEPCWGCCLTTLATLTNHELTARVADKETLLNSVVAL